MVTEKKNKLNPISFQNFRIGKFSFLVGLLLMISVSTFAQVTDPEGDVDTPIDGGVSLLVAAGVAYGVKQWRNNRNPEKKEKENAEL